MDSWSQNTELWNLLKYAEGGDVAFVGFNNGLFANGAFYRFNGVGQDSLWGITISDIYGGMPELDSGNIGLAQIGLRDLFEGNQNAYWGGIIRWVQTEDSSGIFTQTFPHFKNRATLSYSEGDFELKKAWAALIDLIDPIDKALIWLQPDANKWYQIGSSTHGFHFQFYYTGLAGPVESAEWQFSVGKYTYPSAEGDPREDWLGPVYGFFPQTQ